MHDSTCIRSNPSPYAKAHSEHWSHTASARFSAAVINQATWGRRYISAYTINEGSEAEAREKQKLSYTCWLTH